MRLTAATVVIAAAAFAADAGLYYASLRAEIDSKEATLRQRAMLRPSTPRAVPPVDPDEYAFARDTIRRIATPWDSFFEALEQAHSERVVLFSIEPDVETGTVMIAGEAKDYLAALTYASHLSSQEQLAGVHFVRHELKRSGGVRPLSFAISATWKEQR
jgi:type IV pilus assembly PilN-like protein